ncbi:MAG TPA: FAD-dependent oxidoreductase, partial [Caulobacteraceae bacterium]|nr:FAD-dependent oxidoreductase [Caulobacteraceae bacterium]
MKALSNLSVVVAGAGALGACAALAIAEAGARVTLADPSPDRSASAVAAGMLAPGFETLLDPPAAGRPDLLEHGRRIWDSLAERIGLDLDRRGALGVAPAEDLDRWQAAAAAVDFPNRRLARREAEALIPGLRAGDGGL